MKTTERIPAPHPDSVLVLRMKLKVVSGYLASQQCETDNQIERNFVASSLLLLDMADADPSVAGINYEVVKKQTAELIANTNAMLLNHVRTSKVTQASRRQDGMPYRRF